MDASSRASQAPILDPLRHFAQLERVLAGLLLLTPLLLIGVDTGPDAVRSSISAYHDVARPEVFYLPLVVAAMLFVVNGVLKEGHWYNWVLGAFLFVLLAFDHDGRTRDLHLIGAAGFFVGNVAVMMLASRGKHVAHVMSIAGTVVATLTLCLVTDWFTVFWAEWTSLAIITAHYILDTIPTVRYTALTKPVAASSTLALPPPPPIVPPATRVAA